MRTSFFLKALLLIAIFLTLAISSFAQYGASLQGTVRDATGDAVVGASVTATNQSTGVGRNTTTGESGFYRISGLPPGTYSVGVEAASFKKSSTSNLKWPPTGWLGA